MVTSGVSVKFCGSHKVVNRTLQSYDNIMVMMVSTETPKTKLLTILQRKVAYQNQNSKGGHLRVDIVLSD